MSETREQQAQRLLDVRAFFIARPVWCALEAGAAAIRRVEALERERDEAEARAELNDDIERLAHEQICQYVSDSIGDRASKPEEMTEPFEVMNQQLAELTANHDAALRDVATLREALEVMVKYADRTFDHWDKNEDSKVGKRLNWMAGRNEGYEPNLHVHTALANTAAAAEAYERRVREPLERRVAELEKRIIGLRDGLMNAIKASGGVANPGITDEFMILGVPAEMAERKKRMDEMEQRIAELEAACKAAHDIAANALTQPLGETAAFVNICTVLESTPTAALDEVKREAAAEENDRWAKSHRRHPGCPDSESHAAEHERRAAELRAGGSDE